MSVGHPRSRMFKVSASLLLSTAYFVAAIGVWMVQQGKTNISADVNSGNCPTAGTATDTFDSYPMDGSQISPPGWVPDAGQVITGQNNQYQYPQGGVEATMNLGHYSSSAYGTPPAVRVTKMFRDSSNGSVRLFLYGGDNGVTGIDPVITLLTKHGTALTLRFNNNASGIFQYNPQSTLEYLDPGTGGWTAVRYNDPLGGPGTFGLSRYMFGPTQGISLGRADITITWTPTTFSVGGSTGVAHTYSFDANSIVGIALTGGAYKIIGGYPVDVPAQCPAPTISSITPASGSTLGGTNILINGSNFATASTVTIGGVAATNVVAGGSTITATTPAHAAGAVSVVVRRNVDGQSATGTFTYIAPTITSVTPASGSILGGTVVTVAGTDFATGATLTLGGVAATVTAVTLTSITATTGVHAAGAVDVVLTNPGDTPVTKTGGYTYVDMTVSAAGVALVCPANDPGKQVTEDFEAFTNGQTKEFGWGITAPENTAATIRKDVGKSGNALELNDTNASNGSAGTLVLSRGLKATDKGTVSFDVQPKQTTGRFSAVLTGSKGDMVAVYLAPDGSFQYWNDAAATASKYVTIGTSKYKANEYLNLKLDWDSGAKTFNVSVNGTKINTDALPYSYVASAGSVTALTLNTGFVATANFTDTFLVDNVIYPGCVSNLSMTVNPTTGVAPLDITAAASLPSKNLLNEPYTELNDTGGSGNATSIRTATGGLKIDDVPKAAVCDAQKSWDYDLQNAKLYQYQWKRTIPDKATVESTISWQSSTADFMQGKIGIIGSDGTIHVMAGFHDGSGSGSGNLGGERNDYVFNTPTCSSNTTDLWTASTAAASDTGTAKIKLVRDGSTVSTYINDQKLPDQTVQGDIAGIAVITSAFPTFEYGSFTVESLTLTDNTLTWDFGDGSTSAKCVGGPEGAKCGDATIPSAMTVKHTYTKGGKYPLSLTVGSETVKQDITVTDPVATTSTNATTNNSAVEAVKKAATLISSGGSLAINLGLAAIFSLTTTFFLLRRHSI